MPLDPIKVEQLHHNAVATIDNITARMDRLPDGVELTIRDLREADRAMEQVVTSFEWMRRNNVVTLEQAAFTDKIA